MRWVCPLRVSCRRSRRVPQRQLSACSVIRKSTHGAEQADADTLLGYLCATRKTLAKCLILFVGVQGLKCQLLSRVAIGQELTTAPDQEVLKTDRTARKPVLPTLFSLAARHSASRPRLPQGMPETQGHVPARQGSRSQLLSGSRLGWAPLLPVHCQGRELSAEASTGRRRSKPRRPAKQSRTPASRRIWCALPFSGLCRANRSTYGFSKTKSLRGASLKLGP
jgi:hypothetical protein